MIKIWSKGMCKKVAMNTPESGLSIVEIIISLAIAAIIGMIILLVLSTNYRVRQQDYILTSKLVDAAIMKQALNKSVTMAGAIAAPSASSVTANLFSAEFTLSTPPISVAASTVSFSWVSDTGSGRDLCQGTLVISGDVMRYRVSTQYLSGSSATCTSNGQPTAEADFLIGTGWSFQPMLQVGTNCMGPAFAFSGQTADALVAIKSPMAGTSATSSTASTQVSVCLPNWNQ